jgi:uncharacterized protein (DUF2062 family)
MNGAAAGPARIKKMMVRLYERFVKLRGSPHAIAMGLALGLFIGMSPFFGLHTVTAVPVAAFFRWSKLAAVIGVNFTNAFTAPLIYPVTYWIGSKLVGAHNPVKWSFAFSLNEFIAIIKQSPSIIFQLLIGGIVLGLPLAAAGYYFSLKAIQLYRRQMHQHRIQKARKKKVIVRHEPGESNESTDR